MAEVFIDRFCGLTLVFYNYLWEYSLLEDGPANLWIYYVWLLDPSELVDSDDPDDWYTAMWPDSALDSALDRADGYLVSALDSLSDSSSSMSDES